MVDTVVTAFYHTNRDTVYNYLGYARAFTLALPCHVIVFTPREFVGLVTDIRCELGYKERTTVISMEFEDLPMYTFYDVLKNTFIKLQDNSNVAPYSPEYTIIVNSKFWFLEYTLEKYPFEYIVWLDFGLAKRGYGKEQIYKFINLNLSDRPRYAIISPDVDITDKNGFLYLAAGGLISVHKSNTQFLKDCQIYLSLLINTGNYPLEELALYYMYIQGKSDHYFGEYTTLIYKYNGEYPKNESRTGMQYYTYKLPNVSQ
jgi:hypothetical protein